MSEERLGKYRLIKLLAVGGMGEVFLAKIEGPAGFARTVVVKRILKHLSREQSFVQMFLEEARVAAQLSHPNIVQIIELGEHGGSWFIAMEYVHGLSARAMRQHLHAKGGEAPPVVVARVMAQALHGLHHAHTATNEQGKPLNIIHRDVSADNVMIGFNGSVKVLDFGIAKASDAITTTRTGTVKGKYAYMSPEQLLAEPLDRRADVYSAGVVMYELLAGQRPYIAPAEAALVRKILDTPLPPLIEKAPHVPPELATMVTMALEKDRESRFASAEHFALAIDSWVNAQPLDPGLMLPAFMRANFATASGEFPAAVTPSGPQAPATRDPALISFSSPLLGGPDVPTQHTGATGARSGGRLLAVAGGVVLAFGTMIGVILALTPAPQEHAQPAAVAIETATKPREFDPSLPDEGEAAVDAGGEAEAVPVEQARPAPAAAPDSGTAVAAAQVRPAPVRGKGKLDLRVNPWAEVFDGSKSLGVTPFAPLELAAGPHVLVLKNEKLDVTRKVKTTVVAGKTTVLRVDLLE